MSDNMVAQVSEGFDEQDYIEDEFGIALKGFLLGRFVFGLICAFMVLGALVCVFTGLTNFDVLISSATALMPSAVDQNFSGYQLCMYLLIYNNSI